jgi:chemotaxis protein MotB
VSSGGAPGKKRGHEEEHEEHENHERWLLTYADMITLLMVLFIVMFAISQVDQRKFMALKTGLTAGFGSPLDFLTGADAMLETGGSVAPDSVNLPGQANGQANEIKSIPDPGQAVNPAAVAELAEATSKATVSKEVEQLTKARDQIAEALRKAKIGNAATFRFDERGLVVTIATDKVLFASGSADLTGQGRKVLTVLAPTLKALPNHLSVDGHTNQVPLKAGSRWSSDWELASARAVGVLVYLNRSAGIPPDRMSASSFGETAPLYSPKDPRAVDLNRRVEIVVLAQLDDSAGRALAALGNKGTATTQAESTEAESTGAESAEAGSAEAASPAPETPASAAAAHGADSH